MQISVRRPMRFKGFQLSQGECGTERFCIAKTIRHVSAAKP
jgi:hypothetical protein